MRLPRYESNLPQGAANITSRGGIATGAAQAVAPGVAKIRQTLASAADDLQAMSDLNQMTKASAAASKAIADNYAAAREDKDLNSTEKYNNAARAALDKVASTLPSHLQGKFLAERTPFLTSQQVQHTAYNIDRLKKDTTVSYNASTEDMKIDYAQGNDAALVDLSVLTSNYVNELGIPEAQAKATLEKLQEEFKMARIDYEIQNMDGDITDYKLQNNHYGLKDTTQIKDLQQKNRAWQKEKVAQQNWEKFSGQLKSQKNIEDEIDKDPLAYTPYQLEQLADKEIITQEFARVMGAKGTSKFLDGKEKQDLLDDVIGMRFLPSVQKEFNKMSEAEKMAYTNKWMVKVRELKNWGVITDGEYRAIRDSNFEQRATWADKFMPGQLISKTYQELLSLDRKLGFDYINKLAQVGVGGSISNIIEYKADQLLQSSQNATALVLRNWNMTRNDVNSLNMAMEQTPPTGFVGKFFGTVKNGLFSIKRGDRT